MMSFFINIIPQKYEQLHNMKYHFHHLILDNQYSKTKHDSGPTLTILN